MRFKITERQLRIVLDEYANHDAQYNANYYMQLIIILPCFMNLRGKFLELQYSHGDTYPEWMNDYLFYRYPILKSQQPTAMDVRMMLRKYSPNTTWQLFDSNWIVVDAESNNHYIH